MTERGLQGWYEDPFYLHEARYFSAGQPTKLVRDGEVESYDEPPADGHEAAGAVPAGPDKPQLVTIGRPYDYSPDYAPEVQKKSHAGLLATVTVIAVFVVVAGVAIASGSRSSNKAQAISPAAFITHSAEKTLAERTADVTLSGTIEAAGQRLTLNGTGQIDLHNNAMAITATSTLPGGQSLEEKETLVNGNLYLGISFDGKGLAQMTGGKGWIRMPVQQSRSADLVGSDPISSLATLEQQGNTVQSLGTKIVDGVRCTGYAVTPGMQSMITAAKQEYAKLGLSSSAADQGLNLTRDMSPPTVTLWIDANELVHRMSVSLAMNLPSNSASGGNEDASGDIVMDFSHFGTPVKITAPRVSDTVSFQSFLNSLGTNSIP